MIERRRHLPRPRYSHAVNMLHLEQLAKGLDRGPFPGRPHPLTAAILWAYSPFATRQR